MQLTPTNGIPAAKAKGQYKNVMEYIDDFMQMDAKCVRVNFSPYEFRNAYSASASFRRIIRIHNCPIKTSVVNDELYLTKIGE